MPPNRLQQTSVSLVADVPLASQTGLAHARTPKRLPGRQRLPHQAESEKGREGATVVTFRHASPSNR